MDEEEVGFELPTLTYRTTDSMFYRPLMVLEWLQGVNLHEDVFTPLTGGLR